MKIFFLLNPSRRKKEWDYRELAAQISHRFGWTARFGEIDRKNPNSMDQLLRQAREEDCTRIGVLGGDGTLHKVVNVLQRQKRLKETEIAPLPGGTCNDFARYLGYHRKRLEEALKKACSGKAEPVDLGLMDSEVFLNNAGIGRQPTNAPKPTRPLKTLKNFRPLQLKAIWEKGSIEGLFYMAMACNGPYFSGGLHFSKKPVLNDGLLDIYFVPKLPKWRLFTHLMLGRLGRPVRPRQLITVQVKQIEIQSQTELWPQADGEPPVKPVHRVVFSVSPEKSYDRSVKISQMLAASKPLFSFEFFPPKDDASTETLMGVAHSLRDLQPDYISVTYGAGGSTRARTLELVTRIKREVGIETMAHLTCVGHSRQEIRAILDEIAGNGIENVLALRGDPPKGQTEFKPHPDGFRYANELAGEVARLDRFCFGVAGYPEKHVEATSLEADLEHLKRKVDTGAAFVITQLFFINERYFEFVNRARAVGISCPIIPGIMPVTNFAQIQRFTTMCGAKLPQALAAELEPAQSDPEAVTRIGIRYAAAQCRELLQKGAPGIHFYTLNKSRATREILETLRGFRDGPSPLLRDV